MPKKKSIAKPQPKEMKTPTNDSQDPYTCLKCFNNLNDNENFIKCSLCNNYAHHDCLGLTKQLIQYLESSNEFPYLCTPCKPKLNMLERMDTFESSLVTILASLDALKSLDTLKERISNLETKLKKSPMQNPELPTITNHIHTQPPQHNPEPNPEPNSLVNTTQTKFDIPISIREAIEREAIERERRRPNAILFGLNNNDNDDITTVRNIIKDYQASTISAEEILDISRIGRELKNRDGSTAPRMCRVTCINETSKRKLIHAINSLSKTNSNHKNLHCRPDLTIQQRARSRELRTELHYRLGLGEKDLYIDYRAGCIKSKPHIPQLSFNPQPQPYLYRPTIQQDYLIQPITTQGDHNHPSTTQDHLIRPIITQDHRNRPTTTQDYLNQPNGTLDYPIRPPVTQDHLNCPTTSQDHPNRPSSAQDHLKLPTIAQVNRSSTTQD